MLALVLEALGIVPAVMAVIGIGRLMPALRARREAGHKARPRWTGLAPALACFVAALALAVTGWTVPALVAIGVFALLVPLCSDAYAS